MSDRQIRPLAPGRYPVAGASHLGGPMDVAAFADSKSMHTMTYRGAIGVCRPNSSHAWVSWDGPATAGSFIWGICQRTVTLFERTVS
jgi:hypothetical protein